MTDHTARVRELNLYRQYFELVAAGAKTPTATRDQQLANIRTIYGPEKEALGALAIEIERVA